MGADQRIGRRFMRPGIGYGGSCFPKDVAAFRAVAREFGYDFRLLEEVMRINEAQRHMFLRKVRSALWTLKGKRLAVLGLAFKGGTDDIRDSPAIAVIRMLLKERCEIVAYDPAATERARKEFADAPITFADSAYEAAEKADALLILTDWEEFGALDFPRLRQALNHPILIDGRNLYSRAEMERHGFAYFSVGRQEALPIVPAALKRTCGSLPTRKRIAKPLRPIPTAPICVLRRMLGARLASPRQVLRVISVPRSLLVLERAQFFTITTCLPGSLHGMRNRGHTASRFSIAPADSPAG